MPVAALLVAGGALICWGFVLRSRADDEYTQFLRDGGSQEYMPTADARRSQGKFNGNAAIAAGAALLLIGFS